MRAFRLGFVFAASISYLSSYPFVSAGQSSSARAISEGRYTRAHSLGEGYSFDPRDGWEAVNTTDLKYKYRRSLKDDRPNKEGYSMSRRGKGLGIGIVTGALGKVFKGLKGVGKPEKATITWYTGHDLLNPSCWANGNWAPTDESFACALTMEGWTNRPKCFKFLELCNSPKKCVFVRVVDTCAGCAAGSKHVDLTKAAFSQLASPDVGVLEVQFRPATEPHAWSDNLWGPQVKHKK